MVQGAVYDAVNAIDGGRQPYLVAPSAEPWYSTEAAVAAAAFRVLVGLFPAQESALLVEYNASLASIDDGPAKAGGIGVGEASAAAMLAARANDGRFGPFTVVEGFDPGDWRLAPPQGPAGIVARDPAPWVGNVDPFIVPDVETLRTDGPNPLTSVAYADDFNEIKELGSLTSTKRTADQTAAAIFWQDSGIAIWNRVYRAVGGQRGPGHRRQRAPLRDDEPCRGRRVDRLLERQVALELLAADHRDPRGRGGRQPGDRARPGLGAAVRSNRARLRSAARDARLPGPSGRTHLHQPAPRRMPCRPSSAPTRSPSR